LPWIAAVDKFQHLLYLNPNHSTEEREQMWAKTWSEFNGGAIDWTGYENFYKNTWQKQLHIFEIPFYYIEYGFAQLGAIAVWRNYKINPEKALSNYENALKLGYSAPIPEIYKTAGIEFNFSKNYIADLMDFVKQELLKI
jgi:oligoendopeptidase F